MVLAEIDGDGVAEHRPVESVTQTLHVISEYQGAGSRVETEAEDLSESAHQVTPTPSPTPVAREGSLEPPQIELRALDNDPRCPRRNQSVRHAPSPTAYIPSLIAVAIGVALALLVVWLFLGS